jgi:integrase
MQHKITTEKSRRELAPRRDPYWHQLAKGQFLGFRKTGPKDASAKGTWIARYRDRAGKQHFRSLQEHPEFTHAKKAADAWFESLSGAVRASVRRGTVRAALNTYVKHLIAGDRLDAAGKAQAKLEIAILHDGEEDLLESMLETVTRDEWESFHQRLRKTGTGEDRSNSTINRYYGTVTAALNTAVRECGIAGNPEAWRIKDLPEDETEGETATYISREHRPRLLKNCTPEVRTFLEVMWAAGARTSEVALLRVSDYDLKSNTLVLRHKKGRPAKWRKRVIEIRTNDAPLFKSLAKGKLPTAWLVTNEHGEQFERHQWAIVIRAAIWSANATAMKESQKIPEDVTAYSFRHSRISEMLQFEGLNPMQVAIYCGTSIAVIQKYYWKFIPGAMRDQLDQALRA